MLSYRACDNTAQRKFCSKQTYLCGLRGYYHLFWSFIISIHRMRTVIYAHTSITLLGIDNEIPS